MKEETLFSDNFYPFEKLNIMQRKTCEYILQHILPPVHRACLLVPELTLSILTSSHPLWHIPYEEAMAKLDRSDPWWAFLWPGSQALSRYVFLSFANKTFNCYQ